MLDKIVDKRLIRAIIRYNDVEGYHLISEFEGPPLNHEPSNRWYTLMYAVFIRESDGKLFIAKWIKDKNKNKKQREHEYRETAYEAEEYTKTVTTTHYRVKGSHHS